LKFPLTTQASPDFDRDNMATLKATAQKCATTENRVLGTAAANIKCVCVAGGAKSVGLLRTKNVWDSCSQQRVHWQADGWLFSLG
jgi:hypothetical protein